MNEPAAPSSFTGNYQFSRADYAALIDVMRAGRWGLRTILGVAWLSAIVLIIGLSSPNWPHFVGAMHELVMLQTVPRFIYLVIIGVLVLIALLPRIIKWRAMRVYPSLSIAGRDISITFDEAGLGSASKGRRDRMDWAAVRQTVTTSDHLLLMISKREGVFVPKRAFADDVEFAAVVALARRKTSEMNRRIGRPAAEIHSDGVQG